MKITKLFVDKIEAPASKDLVFYRDEELEGFALRVTAGGVKSFVLETLINRKVRRMTLGKYGALTVEQARKEAKSLLGKIARGENPIAEKKEQAIKDITLQQAFNDYLAARNALKQTTAKDYESVFKTSHVRLVKQTINQYFKRFNSTTSCKIWRNQQQSACELCNAVIACDF